MGHGGSKEKNVLTTDAATGSKQQDDPTNERVERGHQRIADEETRRLLKANIGARHPVD